MNIKDRLFYGYDSLINNIYSKFIKDKSLYSIKIQIFIQSEIERIWL